jgi:hypothetical protein
MGWVLLGAVLWVCYKIAGVKVDVTIEKDDDRK